MPGELRSSELQAQVADVRNETTGYRGAAAIAAFLSTTGLACTSNYYIGLYTSEFLGGDEEKVLLFVQKF